MTPFTFLTSLLLLAFVEFSLQASPYGPTRRDQDIVVFRPQENVIGPAFSHSFHGEQTVFNAPQAQASGSSQPESESLQAVEEPHKAEATRRDNDMFIMNPYSDSMYGQQFYGSSSEHNAPVAIASGSSGRRLQDIIIYRPQHNVIGPAYSQSFHGEQVVHKPAHQSASAAQEEAQNSADVPVLPPLGPTRREQDIVVFQPKENVIGPAFSGSFHGEQTIYKGAAAPEPAQDLEGGVPSRRENDMYIMKPHTDAMYGQQFYGSSSQHNAPTAIATGSGLPGGPTRREQDIVVFQPKENVIGPAFSGSFHGEQTIYKGTAAPESAQDLDGTVPSRRENDMYIMKPHTDAMYGQQFYGSSSQHNAPTAIATGSGLPGVPTRRENDMYIMRPHTDAMYGQQFYGSSSQHNAPTAIATGSGLPGVPTRRDNDMFIVKPYTDAMYGQQFYGSSSQHNAPTAIATGSEPPVRRNQDIVIFKPQSNIIGPAFGSSYHGGQVIQKAAQPAASPANDEAQRPGEHPQQGSLATDSSRRNNDMFIMQPSSEAMYGQQFYGSSSQHNAPTAISSGSFPTRRSQDIVVVRPEDNVIGPAFSQSFHGEQVIYNTPHQAGDAEDELLHKTSGRREQDIVVFQPKSNVIGPAFGESYYGNQLIQN